MSDSTDLRALVYRLRALHADSQRRWLAVETSHDLPALLDAAEELLRLRENQPKEGD